MCTGAIHILYLFPRIRQPLDGNFAVSGKKFRLPAVAGEEQDLPVPGGLLQKPQGGGAAPVVEIGQGVVQHDGHLLFRRQHQVADGQPHRQIQLVQRPGGEQRCVPEHRVPGGLRGEAEAPVQHHAAVTAAGELGEDLGGPAAQFRGEPVLQGGVGPLQRLHSQADGAVLCLQPGPLFLQRRPAGPQVLRIFQGLELAGEMVRRRPGLGQSGPGRLQIGGDGLPAPDRGGGLVGRDVRLRRLLGLEVTAQPGLPGGGLRLRQLLPADGAGAQQLIRRGDVKGPRGKAPDLQQDALLVGGQRII